MASSVRQSALVLIRGMSTAASGALPAQGHARGILCKVYKTEHLEQILSGDFIMPSGWAFGNTNGALHKKCCGNMKNANSMTYHYKDHQELEQLLKQENMKMCKRCDKHFAAEFSSRAGSTATTTAATSTATAAMAAAKTAAAASKIANKAAQTLVKTVARKFTSEAVRRLLKKTM